MDDERVPGTIPLSELISRVMVRSLDGQLVIACSVLCLGIGFSYDMVVEFVDVRSPSPPQWAFFILPIVMFIFWSGERLMTGPVRSLNVIRRFAVPLVLTGGAVGALVLGIRAI